MAFVSFEAMPGLWSFFRPTHKSDRYTVITHMHPVTGYLHPHTIKHVFSHGPLHLMIAADPCLWRSGKQFRMPC